MPPSINIPPAEIVHDDFSGGFRPDPNESSVPPNALLDVENMIPDHDTGAIKTREGFARFGNLSSIPSDFEVRSMRYFSSWHGKDNSSARNYLILICRKKPEPNPRQADDIRIYALNIDDPTTAAVRIDPSGRIWKQYAADHWGEAIAGSFYGGSEQDPVYRWQPVFPDGSENPAPFDPDATMGYYAGAQWTEGTVYAVGDRVRDKRTIQAENGTTKEVDWVWVATKAHTAGQNNRPKSLHAKQEWEPLGRFYDLWSSTKEYKMGDIVSYEVTNTALFDEYPRSYGSSGLGKKSTFIYVSPTASTGKEPTVNTGYWKAYRGPVSNLARVHGGRLFMRDTDAGTGRVRYSEMADAGGLFDPSQWEGTDEFGAGFFDLEAGTGDTLRAFESLSSAFIITTRRNTWALTGLNPGTWTLRRLGPFGALEPDAICEHEGICYFFGDEGLFMTDGAQVLPVPGNDYFNEWLRDNLNLEASNTYKISMTSYMGLIWISFPKGDNSNLRPNFTLIYDPKTGSFWPQDFGSFRLVSARESKYNQLFFAQPRTPPLVMRYGDVTQDDTAEAVQAFTDIPWYARTAWWTFGTSKEQRRIRRLWALVRAASQTITLELFRNFKNGTPAWTISRLLGTDPVNYVEGAAIRDYDAHACSLRIAGDKAPAVLKGVEIHTQFRRKRYHRTGINA